MQGQILDFSNIPYEGRAYTGLVAPITIFAAFMLAIINKNRKIREYSNYGFIRIFFLSALLTCFFSMGLPFSIKGLEGLLDYAGPLRQFRSIGRFAWVFYFAINIFAFAWLFKNLKGKWRFLNYLALAILLLEAFHFSTDKNLRLDAIPKMEVGKTFNDIPGIDYRRFQGIVTVPYFNVGSDNFWWHSDGFILQNALTLSVQTGLPTTSAMLTRTSLRQRINQIQLIVEPYRIPKILDDLPNQKPFL